MPLTELQKKKFHLEKEIQRLIAEFEQDTMLAVVAIEVVRPLYTGQYLPPGVTARVELESN